ncbi:MAG: hypothetical protein R3F05_17965 [Planctomycetota bacterium]
MSDDATSRPYDWRCPVCDLPFEYGWVQALGGGEPGGLYWSWSDARKGMSGWHLPYHEAVLAPWSRTAGICLAARCSGCHGLFLRPDLTPHELQGLAPDPVACLACGAQIPEGSTSCAACGWSYLPTEPDAPSAHIEGDQQVDSPDE